MLGNEPALERYMSEKPRRRDENIISSSMASQILFMAGWLTLLSFAYLKLPFFASFFETQAQHYTSYFVLFVVAALMNGFNVRDTGFGIFSRLNENPGFLRVWVTIVLVQAFIVNAAFIPLSPFEWISNMFSCTPFPFTGWILVFILAATLIPMDLIRKAVFRETLVK